MEGFEDFALKVDSVIDLIVSIADETLDVEFMDVPQVLGAMAGSGVGPLHEAETRALVETDAWHRDFSPAGDMAGTVKCYKHVARDDQSVKGLEVSELGPQPDPLLGLVPYWAMGLRAALLLCPSTCCHLVLRCLCLTHHLRHVVVIWTGSWRRSGNVRWFCCTMVSIIGGATPKFLGGPNLRPTTDVILTNIRYRPIIGVAKCIVAHPTKIYLRYPLKTIPKVIWDELHCYPHGENAIS